MKVLLCHNYYQVRGGEDITFEDEERMLRQGGHEVVRFTRHNDAIGSRGNLATAIKTLWNRETYGSLRHVLRRERPDVMHCTNLFPLMSPSVYYAAHHERVPVVQALHNFRLACLNSYLLRDGRACEACLHRSIPWPGVLHRCYRGGRLASAAVAGMITLHRFLRSWRDRVAVFYTPSAFARGKLVEAGLPAERVLVKPNFVDPDPGAGTGNGGYAVYAGRLSAEKGIDLLLKAWRLLERPMRLRIAGDGPLVEQVKSAATCSPDIEYVGPRPHGEVLELMSRAVFVIVPSICYETFGRTIIEAYSVGTPVIAARLGAMSELVEEGKTGWLFEPGNPQELARTSRSADLACAAGNAMRIEARRVFLERYTAAANLPMLREIYERALREKNRVCRRPAREPASVGVPRGTASAVDPCGSRSGRCATPFDGECREAGTCGCGSAGVTVNPFVGDAATDLFLSSEKVS